MQGNEQQQKAIEWNTGPALILAGPGSGKTFTTVERVRYLIEVHHVDPSNILVITFTKAAARQMRDRFFTRMEGKFHPVSFGTFHAVFFSILRTSRHYELNSVLSEREKKEYLRIVQSKMPGEMPREEGWEEGLLSEIGYVKNAGAIPENFHSDYMENADFRRLFLDFQKLIRDMGKLDLDDFAAAVRHLFLSSPQTLAAWRQKYSHILVDEFQDINAVQYEVVKMLAGERQNLFVVGDDDQAIYGFRGSDPSIMKQFLRDYPDALQINLSVNYRSSAGIVETAGKVIAQNKERFSKKITADKKPQKYQDPFAQTADGGSDGRHKEPKARWKALTGDGSVQVGSFPNRRQQAKTIADMIGRYLEENSKKGVAAIYRTNADAMLLAEELGKRKIAFGMKEKAKSPYAHAVCRDLAAYLRFAKAGRMRRDFFQIMNKPCRYLSRKAVREGMVSFPELLSAYQDKSYMCRNISKMQTDIGRIAGMDLYAAVNYVRKGMGYDAYLQHTLHGEGYREALSMADFFQDSVREFETVEQLDAHICQYERILLEAAHKEEENAKDVLLMTMHGAKGLEFDIVFLPDCNEGIMPHKKSMRGKELEEERRLFYVGMTRAKERLYLTWVEGNREEPGFVSRFLQECGFRESYRPS
ncbi:MAG: ATP-dependent helicase [Eubacteriales bacterium]|nr:ATP-dependent helicase [Eubacteriales bacterium]